MIHKHTSDRAGKPDHPDDSSAAWAPVFAALGLPSYQVKTDRQTVCICAPTHDHPRLLDPHVSAVLVRAGKAFGYRFVTLDLS